MEVNLSKNGWHYKLQRFMFGEKTPQLDSLCPYFWLTIMCVFLIPIWGPFRLLHYAGMAYKRNVQEPRAYTRLEKFVKNLSDADAARLFMFKKIKRMPNVGHLLKDGSIYENAQIMYLKHKGLKVIENEKDVPVFDLYWRIRDLSGRALSNRFDKSAMERENSPYSKKFIKHLLKLEKALVEEAGEDVYSELNKKAKDDPFKKFAKNFDGVSAFFAKTTVMKATMFFQKVFSLVFTIALAFGIGIGLTYLVQFGSTWNWRAILVAIEFIGLVVAVGMIFFFIIENSEKFFRKVYDIVMKYAIFRIPTLAIYYILYGVVKVVAAPFMLFYYYFRATKNNYCPAINWKNK